MNEQDAIKFLQQNDQYRVIERLIAPKCYQQGAPVTPRIGLVLDVEATGLDTVNDKIIELGFVAFEYDASTGQIYRILHTYDGFEDPCEPLSDIVKQITGISDDMLTDQHLDDDQVKLWLDKTSLIVAHNAAFDRQMLERRYPDSLDIPWACTLTEINWMDENIASLKLDYIAYRLGYFFEGHRAVNDAQATLHLLSKPLPESGKLGLNALLANAREKTQRLFAVAAPFEKKDSLKERGYRWMADFSYTDRYNKTKKGVWSKSVPAADIEAEHTWLIESVYKGNPAFQFNDLTAKERFSIREFKL